MAYVRRRGNQLAIVHGEREPGTGKVQQRILFTIYSKAEALEILERGGTQGGAKRRVHFESLFRRQFPDLTLDWKAIRLAIEDNLKSLPDLYEYRSERLRGRFREDLCAFTRQLVLADPQDLMSAANLIQEHRHELEYLTELIGWRLKLREQKESEWNMDNPFYWRFSLQGRDVPPDTEEHAAGFYERGEYERAKAVFLLLVDCFPGYAEGYNYLGLVALAQRRLEEAIGHFEKTAELGRKLFPARIGKRRYWSDHATRPYMRGLMNLAQALNEAGRFDEALSLCDRLENECGDKLTADSHRAPVFLNTGEWERAAGCARSCGGEWDPSAGFVEGFALFELGRFEELLPPFVEAALRTPRAARMAVGARTAAPRFREEASDYNSGVSLGRSLHAYFAHQRPVARKFFRGLVCDPRVTGLLDEVIAVVARRHDEHPASERSTFDRMTLMRSPAFAAAEARRLRDLLPRAGTRGFAMQ